MKRTCVASAMCVVMALPGMAVAGDLYLDQFVARGGGTGAPPSRIDVVAHVRGGLRQGLGGPVTMRVAGLDQTLPQEEFRVRGRKATYTGTPGAAGVSKAVIDLRSGRIRVVASGGLTREVGALEAFGLHVGTSRVGVLLPLRARRGVRRWDRSDPVRVELRGRIFDVSDQGGAAVLVPAARLTIPAGPSKRRSGTGPGAGTQTDEQGNFSAVVELPSIRSLVGSDVIDFDATVGRAPDRTSADGAPLAAGIEDGTYHTAVFVEPVADDTHTIDPADDLAITERDASGRVRGVLVIPVGAAEDEVAGLRFSPCSLLLTLPAPIPPEYVGLAGAHVEADEDVRFRKGARPTVELAPAEGVSTDELASASIRMLEFIDGEWVESPGGASYDPETGLIGPDPDHPAKIRGTNAIAYVVDAPSAEAERISGSVVDGAGAPVIGAPVFTQSAATVSDELGTWEIRRSGGAGDSLDVVQVVAGDRTSAGASVGASQVDLTLGGGAAFEWIVGQVSGTVYDRDGTTPIEGATVTVRVAPGFMGITRDDRGTRSSFGDDVFSVGSVAGFGVTEVQWGLDVPGRTDAFISSAATTTSVRPSDLMIEAQDGGYSLTEGAYGVRASYTMPGIGPVTLFAGFQVEFDGISISISDIQLPTPFSGAASTAVETGTNGTYTALYRAPRGAPLEASARSTKAGATSWEPFAHAPTNTVDLADYSLPPTGTSGEGDLANDSDTVALWHFTESSGQAMDSSGNGYHGTVMNGAQQGVPVSDGTGIRLDGIDDYVSLPTSLLSGGLPQGTIEAVILIDGYPDADKGWLLFDRGDPASHTSAALELRGTGGLQVALNSTVVYGPTAAVPKSVRTHLMMTWNGSVVREYIDGDLVREATSSAAPAADGSNRVQIGVTIQMIPGYYFRGIIDEMRISRVARIPAAAAGWKQYGGHWYRLTSGTMTWLDARDEAASLGGYLTTINDAAEGAALYEMFRTEAPAPYFYTGLNDIAAEGVWTWDNGDPVAYTNWQGGEPSNSHNDRYGTDEDCTILGWGGTPKWWDYTTADVDYIGIIERDTAP